MSTLMRLTRDVKNPRFDGRCRYSIESVKLWAAGTVFKLHPANPGVKNDYPVAEFRDRSVLGTGLVDALVAAAEPAGPANVLELTLDLDMVNWDLRTLLQDAVDSGAITLEGVSALLKAGRDHEARREAERSAA